MKNLRIWNSVMAVLHFAQACIMVFLSSERLIDIQLYLPNPNELTRSFDLAPETWYSVNLGYTISAFLFLSALAHTITVLPGVYQWYQENLKQKMNLIRWYEYALSSSVMIYVIAILSGMRDGLALLLLVGLNACMNLFGATMEMHNSDKRKLDGITTDEDKPFQPNWWSFVYGSFAGILPWVVMSVYFFVSLDRIASLDSIPTDVKEVLDTVRFIFPTLFVFFNCFAINMALQYKQVGPWKSYLFGEKVYIILSLTAKSFLAWFIWGGTLRG